MRQTLFVLIILSWTTSLVMGFESKWDRVLEYGKALKRGSPESRLANKDSILTILLSQEEGYPVYFVDQSATGLNDGSNWENAFTDVQPAIDAAAETEGWVWVAQGNYVGTYPYTDGAIKIKSRVILLGGFAGYETNINQRDFKNHETILRGWRGRRAVDMDHLSMIDGFSVCKSGYKNTTGMNATDVAGGGIRSMAWFSIIRNNRIYDNNAKDGGGVVIWGRLPHHRISDYTSILENNTIYDNYGVCGAGVTIRNSEILFCNNVVAYNYHERRAKGVEIIIDPEISDGPIIVNSIIWHNSTAVWGSEEGMSFPDLYNHVEHTGRARSYYNCIQSGMYGEGSISEDPQFKDPENWDFTLLPDSPCINAGLPDAPLDPDDSQADIGIYTPPYYSLTITSHDSQSPVPKGSGQYLQGEIVELRTDTLVLASSGETRYRFLHWEGTGSGSYSGSSPQETLIMSNNITETAFWTVEHFLSVEDDSLSKRYEGWYAEGDTVTLAVPKIIYESDYSRKKFSGWTLDHESPLQGSDTSFALPITHPWEWSLNWTQQYKLTTNVQPDYAGNIIISPSGSWFSKNQTIQLTAVPRDTNFTFTHWNSDTLVPDPVLELQMTQGQIATAHFYSALGSPLFVSGLPDTTIDEDSPLIFNLNQLQVFVHDSNDSLEELSYRLIGPSAVHLIQTEMPFSLGFEPEPNWFGGPLTLILEVADQFAYVDSDTFLLDVKAVPDPPNRVDLIQPVVHEYGPDSLSVFFQWHNAHDPDPNDELQYTLYLSPDSTLNHTLIQVETGQDTSATIELRKPAQPLYWAVRVLDQDQFINWSFAEALNLSYSATTKPEFPLSFRLIPNYPNPFNSATTLSYTIPSQGLVTVRVLNTNGELVKELSRQVEKTGSHQIIWRGLNQDFNTVATGSYIVQIEYNNQLRMQKILFIQ